MDIRAIYNDSFIKGKLGYFGTLQCNEDGIHFSGTATKFNLSQEETTLHLAIADITKIQVGWRRIFISTTTKKISFKVCFLYDASGLAPATSTLGVVGALAERKKYKLIESEIFRFHTALLANTFYAQKTAKKITGTKKSTQTLIVIMLVLAAVITFIVALTIILSRASITGESEYGDCIVQYASPEVCSKFKK